MNAIMSARHLVDTMANIATANGQALVLMDGNPVLRVRKHFAIRVAIALLDPIHPYPLRVFPDLNNAQRFQQLIETARQAGVDFIRMRYIEKPHLLATLDLPSGSRWIPHTTAICDGAAQDMQVSFSKNTKWRRLQKEHGTLSFLNGKDADARTVLLEKMLIWKKYWLRENGAAGTGFRDPVHLQALRRLVDADTGILRLHALMSGETPVAIEACLSSKDELFNLITSYDPVFEKYGPGTLLSKFSIAHAAHEGYARVDFLPPVSNHKLRFAKRKVPLAELQIPLTIKGRSAIAAAQLRSSFLREGDSDN